MFYIFFIRQFVTLILGKVGRMTKCTKDWQTMIHPWDYLANSSLMSHWNIQKNIHPYDHLKICVQGDQ